jgi:hypothetical protein
MFSPAALLDISLRRGHMKKYTTYQFDNRDAAQMYEYMEARIEALKRRVVQLEEENENLKWQLFTESDSDQSLKLVAASA